MSLTAIKRVSIGRDFSGGARGSSDDPVSDYRDFCKPKTADLLEALGLNVAFHRASGSYVFYRTGDDAANEKAVLDLVGGFGACLFGHNHPEIKGHLVRMLNADMPAFVQGASRKEASRLAAEMNAALRASGTYYCNFVNSGAEAVEATLKHAYKVRLDAINVTYETISRELNTFYHECDQLEEPPELPEQFTDLSKFRDIIDEHNLAQVEDFQNHPVVCALKGSFHGKTTTALKLTFNKTYREAFEGLSSIKPVFFERARPERVEEIIRAHQVSFLRPVVVDNRVEIETVRATKVIGLILEIIQGEGGVRPIPTATLRYLADRHDELGIPYIVDEVQTGFGRAGAVAAYEDTPLGGIEPEYLIFGKALGGGIAKIAASLVHEKCYDPDFGLLHTSTFGEDDLSCAIGRRVLDMLLRDDGRILDEINSKGSYFRSRLIDLRRKYPNIVKDIRGRGLMLGLEFSDLGHLGPLFRYAGQKGFFSLLVASYMLHRHDVRILAPLSTLFKGNPGKRRPAIIRLQPPVTISRIEIERFIDALDETLSVVSNDNEFELLAHLVDAVPRRRLDAPSRTIRRAVSDTRLQFDARVGFVVPVTKLEYLIEYYLPTFSQYHYDERKLAKWWTRLSRFLEPELVHKTYIESDGFVVEANIIVVPYLADSMIKLFAVGRHADASLVRRQRLKELTDRIQDATIVARDLGDERIPTSIVGLGSFTSIVTQNGETVNDYEIPITTGNAYTTVLMVEGFDEAARRTGLDLEEATVGIVGAGGNIGRILTRSFVTKAKRLVLIGRDTISGREKIVAGRNQCLADVIAEVTAQLAAGLAPSEIELNGIAGRVYRRVLLPVIEGSSQDTELAGLVRAIRNGDVPSDAARILSDVVEAVDPNLITIGRMSHLKECDVVAIATNSTDAKLIGPNHVKKGAIVGCASVPSNLSRNFADSCEEYFVFDGGYARLPEDGKLDFVGMPKDGLAFGCLCETLLAGFDGMNKSFVKGDLTAQHVAQTLEMAENYGFKLGDFQLSGKPLKVAGKLEGVRR